MQWDRGEVKSTKFELAGSKNRVKSRGNIILFD